MGRCLDCTLDEGEPSSPAPRSTEHFLLGKRFRNDDEITRRNSGTGYGGFDKIVALCRIKSTFRGKKQFSSLLPFPWPPTPVICILQVFLNAVTWYAAEATCVSHGGHLASIHSHAENTFIGGTGQKNYIFTV
jgi:hypothetical protein